MVCIMWLQYYLICSKSVLLWHTTYLYLPLRDVSEIDPHINKLLDALLNQLK